MHTYQDEKRVVFMWDDIRKCCTSPELIEFISELTKTGINFIRFYDVIEKLGYMAYIRGKSDAMHEMLERRRSD